MSAEQDVRPAFCRIEGKGREILHLRLLHPSLGISSGADVEVGGSRFQGVEEGRHRGFSERGLLDGRGKLGQFLADILHGRRNDA